MRRAILGLVLAAATTHVLAAEPPDDRRFQLQDGMPEVAWYDSYGWTLAPGYPRFGSGTAATASAPDPITKRRTVSLPAGDSVVLRFTKDGFGGLPPDGSAIDMTISATQATFRSNYRNQEQHDFQVTLTPPPESVAPDEPFEFGARGKASRNVKQTSYDAKAGLGTGVTQTFSDNPENAGFFLGAQYANWTESGSAVQKGLTGRQTQLDWAIAGFRFGLGINVELHYGYTREPKPAVVFLPGVAGSVLESLNALGSFEVWPTAKASSRTTLALEPDGRTPAIPNSMIRVRGVLRSAPANFYGGIIDFLVEKGWKEDEDLFVFPYDWRLDNRSHFEALDQVIRKASREGDASKKRKVVLIAHSMGGVISRAYLLSNAERRKNVKAFISIATPYLGAPKVFYGFANGYSFGNVTVRSELMKVLIQNLPAAYQLVPWEPFVTEGNRTLSLDETYGIRYRGYSQSLAGYIWDTYVPTENTPWFMNPGLVTAAKGFREPQGGKRNPQTLSGVQHYVIIGTGVKTLAGYTLADSKEAQPGLRLGERGIRLEPTFLDGDGTVPLWSLEIAGANRTYYVPYVSQFGSDISSGHADLPGNPRVLDIVGRILAGKAPEANEFRRSTELVEVESLDVSLHSNATLSIEGKGGRLGLNADGAVEETLPTGTMLVTEGGEYASIAALDRSYTAVVNGTGTGQFTLDVLIRRRSGSVAYSYPKVAVEKGTVARVPIDPRSSSTPPPLEVVTAGRTTKVFPTMGVAPPPVAAGPATPVEPPLPPTPPTPLTPPPPPRDDGGRPNPMYEYDTNRYGGDYRNFASTRFTPDECFEACKADNRCQAWTYVKAGYENAGCWLKDRQPEKSANNCCISGTFTRFIDRVPPVVPPPVVQTPPAGGQWSNWIDRDDPSGNADWEALADMRASVPCEKPTAMECRTLDGRDWRSAGQKYKCSLDEPNAGGTCLNADNPAGCFDYEVRYLCAGTAAPATTAGIAVRSATYGRNCKAAEGNVTAHAQKTCDGKSKCDYRIDYTQIGDPAYGCQKDYFVDWSCGGSETFTLGAAPEAGFGSVLALSCPPPPVAIRATPPSPAPAAGIALQSATYGANCGTAAGNVTTHIAKACDGKATCDYKIDYTQIGDPAYGCQKDYSATWTCGGAQTFTLRAAPEAGFGSVLKLSCPPPSGAVSGMAPPPAPPSPPPALPVSTGSTVTLDKCPYGFEEYRGRNTPVVCTCSGSDAAYDGRLYGSDEYTDDSYICKAAVHAGAMDLSGGTVRVVPVPGRNSYPAVTRNGVRSGSWGAWPAAFRVERAAAAPPRAPGKTVVLGTCPYGFDAWREKDTIVVCPCSAKDAAYDGRLYGSDEYTDDSYICKAAVHAGAIGTQGGTVRVIPMPGRASYPAVDRNGVRSGSWGAWGSSYRIERGP